MPEIKDLITMEDNDYLKSNDYFLGVEDLCMHFPAKKDSFGRTVSWIHACDDVTFHVPKGMTLGVVGESGCGNPHSERCWSTCTNRQAAGSSMTA